MAVNQVVCALFSRISYDVRKRAVKIRVAKDIKHLSTAGAGNFNCFLSRTDFSSGGVMTTNDSYCAQRGFHPAEILSGPFDSQLGHSSIQHN
jgi:hypothetical protein